MKHVKITFKIQPGTDSDILVARLADIGYDGFEETETELLAYISEADFNENELKTVADNSQVEYVTEIIPEQNWNALWESNFQPVIVDGFCTIRAHFHDITVTTPYDIIITPKMSFGTGHHATTQLMMAMMKDMPLKGSEVLDFGTGTGVLAILAEMLGAAKVLAIDNDPWCIENSIENAERNKCKNITVQIGSLEDAPPHREDVILANINRHILLHYMAGLYERLKSTGMILMSGLLTEDEPVVIEAALKAGFSFIKGQEQNGWIALLFRKE